MAETKNISVTIGQDWSGDFAYDQAASGDAVIMIFYNNNTSCTQIATENYSGEPGEVVIDPGVKYTCNLPAKKTFFLDEHNVTYKLFILNLQLQESTLLYSGGVAITPDPNAVPPDIWDGEYPTRTKTVESLPDVNLYKAGDEIFVLGDGMYYNDGSEWVKYSDASGGVPDGSITDKKLAKDAVSGTKILYNTIDPQHITFLKPGKNLFNKYVATAGKYVNENTGELSENQIYCATDFIKVDQGKNYQRNYNHSYALYDVKKKFIEGHPAGSADIITIPTNAAFIRLTIGNNVIDTYQFEEGDTQTSYEAFKMTMIGVNGELISASEESDNLTPDEVTIESLHNNKIQIKDNGVGEQQLGIISPGKNLFNKNLTTDGYISKTGVKYSSTTYCFSEYIRIESNTDYFIAANDGIGARFVTFYNKEREVVDGGIDVLTNNFTTPNEAAYVIVSIYKNRVETTQLEKGNAATYYESYRLLPNVQLITTPELKEDMISVSNCDFLAYGKNLFDKNKRALGYYVNETNGKLSLNANYDASDYIEVIAGEKYARNYDHSLAYYNDEKTFISGSSAGSGAIITIPEGGKYVRLTIHKNVVDTYQFEKGTAVTDYEPFSIIADNFVIDSEREPPMILPKEIFVALDRELNIWYDALVNLNPDVWSNDIRIISSVGKNKQRSFRFTPSVIADNNLQINLISPTNKIINAVSTTIKAVPKNNGSGAKQFLFIGDSLTHAGVITAEFRNLIISDGGIIPTMLGTQGTSPNNHEGHSGKTFAWFVSDASPFWNSSTSKLDFQNYMTSNNYSGNIDFAMVQLGINDVFSGVKTQDDIDQIITDAKTLIDAMLDTSTGYPTCKILLALPPIGSFSRDGFSILGNNYQKRQYEENMRLLWKNLLSNFDDNAYSPQVTISSNGLWVDRQYGYPSASVNVSARSNVVVEEQTNDVHPNDSGYKQIADAFYSTFRGVL